MMELKYQAVREALESAIVSGEYVAGDQLPAEIDIARRFNVSLMTARRAVSDLVAADLLERRSRKGTFVRARTRARLAKVTVNFITVHYDGPFHLSMVNQCVRAIEEQGWHANVVRLDDGQQDSAVRLIERGGYAVISMGDVRDGSALGRALRAASNRIVSLDPDSVRLGVPSVATEMAANIRLAWDRLRQSGHDRIAIASQFVARENDSDHVVSWQRRFMDTIERLDLDLRLIRVYSPLMLPPTQNAYETVLDFLERNDDITAMISVGDELTVGVLAACRDAGRSCPDRISIVGLYDSPLMKFSVPAVTSVDVDYSRQMAAGVEILKANMAGSYSGEILRYTRSRLIERESVNGVPAHGAVALATV